MREIAGIFLVFDSQYMIIPLLLGMIVINRRLFFDITYLLLFSILINVALKVTFQVPLILIPGHPGYGLPSGHMQAATVFYGSLAWYVMKKPGIPRLISPIIVLSLLTGIGWALVYKGFHSLNDVLAGALTGLILITIWQPIRRFTPILASAVFAYSAIRYTHLPNHAWIAYGLLLCFALYEYETKVWA